MTSTDPTAAFRLDDKVVLITGAKQRPRCPVRPRRLSRRRDSRRGRAAG
jgi:hypothetical protein